MNNLRYYQHLKAFHQQVMEEEQEIVLQQRDQEVEMKLKEVEFVKKATQQLIQIQEKKNELLTMMHQTELKNKDAQHAIEKEHHQMTIENQQHQMSLMQAYHQHEAMVTNMLHETEKNLQEMGFKESIQELKQESYKKDLELQYSDYLFDDMQERMSLLKEQNTLEGKKGQFKDEMMRGLEKMNDWRNEQIDRESDVERAWLDVQRSDLDIEQKLNALDYESKLLSLKEKAVDYAEQQLYDEQKNIDNLWKMRELEYTNQTLREDAYIERQYQKRLGY